MLNVLAVLTAIVGLPAFLLATTTPLVSARVAERGDDPWWLYAASNAASLGGLLAYPLLIEPRLSLSAQRTGATVLLGVLAVLLGAVLLADRGAERPHQAEPGWKPARQRELVWLLAACMPAGAGRRSSPRPLPMMPTNPGISYLPDHSLAAGGPGLSASLFWRRRWAKALCMVACPQWIMAALLLTPQA